MRYRYLDHRRPFGQEFVYEKKRDYSKLIFVGILIILLAILYYNYQQNPSKSVVSETLSVAQETETRYASLVLPSPSPTFEPLNVVMLETRVHELINVQRTTNGLNELSWNEVLVNAARKHSADMATRNYFTHDSPEGHDLTWRYAQESFVCPTAYGENIEQDWTFGTIEYTNGVETSREWKTLEQIAQSIVNSWMTSEGHRKNILTSNFRTEGIGIAVTSEGEVYTTEDFC